MKFKKIFVFFFCTASAMDPEIVDLLTPLKALREACGYDACANLRNDVLNVHIVPHSHSELGSVSTFDDYWLGIVWDDEESSYIQKPSIVNMKMTFDAVLSELWSTSERKFTLSDSELPYFFYWWARRDATVRRMVYQLLRQGRLNIVGGGWGMHDEATTTYHSIIDSYTYSLRKLNRTFLSCARPLVAWQIDNFGHSREYTSLVAQMGFDGLFINPISFDDELIRMDRNALEFLWRGSDDLGKATDIFTSKLFDGYMAPPGFCFDLGCSDPVIITSERHFANLEERVDLFIEHMKYRQAPYYKTNHIMVIMGNPFAYYAARIWYQNVDTLIHAVNIKSYSSGLKVHLHYSSPHCYLKAVHEAYPVLEPKQDDFMPFAFDKYSYMSGFFTSRPDLKYLIRIGNVYLQVAKQLQVIARLEYDEILESFMWIMGVVQDHRIISGSIREYSKNYYIRRLNDAIEKSMVLINEGVEKLSSNPIRTYYNRCEFNASTCNFNISSNFHIILYNPLAWRVSMPVRIPVKNSKWTIYDSKGDTVNGSLLPISSHVLKIPRRNRLMDYEIVFIATDIPPTGFKSYYFRQIPISKRSIIKKLNPHPQKKYYIRQASDVYNKTYFEENSNYDDIDDNFGEKNYVPKYDNIRESVEISNDDKRAIDFVSVKNYSIDNADVITPKHVSTSTVESTPSTSEVITHSMKLEPVTDDTSTVSDEPKSKDIKDISSTTETIIVNTILRPPEQVSTTTEEIVPKIEQELFSFEEYTQKPEVVSRTPKYMVQDNIIERSKDKSYYGVLSKDNFIENKYIRINLDTYGKVKSLILSNKGNTSLDIQFFYYISDDIKKMGKDNETINPGPFLFRPMDPKPVPIIDFLHTKIFKTDVVQEIHTMYSEYASIVVRLYPDNPFVEVDWVIGPVPIDDDLGKDVFIRYSTELQNSGVFYTDSNGRQTVKRIRNRKPTYEPYKFNEISGNFFPVTTRIYIEDPAQNLRFSIFNDRSQGGSSLLDGSIDLMIQRRLLTGEDSLRTFLNDTIDGKGVIIRGTHYVYLTKADYKPNKVFEKKLAKEIELKPIYLVSDSRIDLDDWLEAKLEFSGNEKLPVGVHVLTLQNWNDGTLLVRLENYLEKCDTVKSGLKYVFLRNLFYGIEVERVKETTLSAHIWLSDWVQWQWGKNGSFVKNFNDYYGTDKLDYDLDEKSYTNKSVDLDSGIKLTPQQIRTFVVWYKNKGV